MVLLAIWPISAGLAGDVDDGHTALEQQDYDRAIHHFSEAIRSGKLDAEMLARAHNNRGVAYKNKGQFDRAIEDYDLAIGTGALLPEDLAFTLNNRGNAYAKKGDLERALEDYDEAIRLHPSYVPAFFNRGIARYTRKEYARAIADYDEAIRLDPDNAGVFNNRGIAYWNLGEHERAVEDYDRAIALAPGYALAYSNRGTAYRSKGDYDRAIEDFDRAIALDPENVVAFNERGIAYKNMGDVGPRDVRRAVSPDADGQQAAAGDVRGNVRPTEDPTLANAGDAGPSQPGPASSGDDPDTGSAGRTTAHAALSSGATTPDAEPGRTVLGARGNAFMRLGHYDRAIQDHDRAIALDPTNARALNDRGNAYRSKGHIARALEDYGDALSLEPDYAEAYANRGVAHTIDGNYDRAMRNFGEAAFLAPNDPFIFENRGQAWFQQALFAKALEDFEHAATLDPDNPERIVWIYLARSRAAHAGEHELAEAMAAGMRELTNALERGESDVPMRHILAFHVGQMSSAALLGATKDGDPATQARRRCRALFHIGQAAQINGNETAAIINLARAAEACLAHSIEHRIASIELQALEDAIAARDGTLGPHNAMAALEYRLGPGLRHARLGTFAEGDVVDVTDYVRGWAVIRLPNGSVAYAPARQLESH